MIIELGKEAKTLNGILKILAWGGFNAACVYILTDNLSTGMIVLGITCILIFVMHPKTKPFLMLVGAGVVVVSAGVFILSKTLETSTSFRLRRVIAGYTRKNMLQTEVIRLCRVCTQSVLADSLEKG